MADPVHWAWQGRKPIISAWWNVSLLWSQVKEAVRSLVKEAVGSQVKEAVRSHVKEAVGSLVK